MADANVPGKNWWRWFEKDTLISIVSALGLDVIFELIKKEGPVVAWTHFKKDLDEKIMTDKRAEMLREFREMEDAGINIDNLRRRHAESMDRSKVDRWAEYRFVQLLCKIQPPDPANPQKVRPPIVPGKPGKPQNDRQADLKWLNDQGDPGDPRFDQMLHFLDHDVVTQIFQIGCDRTGRFLKNLRDDLKTGWTNLTQWMHTHLGPLGDWLVVTAEATLDLIVRFFRWLTHSWLRVAAVAVISLPILLFVALIVGPIRRRVFPWFGIAIGVLLATIAYYLLVPTSLDKTLWLAALMLLAAAFLLRRKFAMVSNTIFFLLAVFTLIFFLGGRTAARNKIEHVFAAGQSSAQRENANLASKPAAGTVAIPTPLASARQTGPQTPTASTVGAATQTNWFDEEWFKPTSGDEGGFIVRVAPCRYTAARVVGCKIYVQPTQGLDSEKLYLNDVNGVDDQGTFNAWVSGVTGNYVRFKGGSYPARLETGMKTPIEISINRPDGVTQIGFDLLISTGGQWIKYSFSMIPVSLN